MDTSATLALQALAVCSQSGPIPLSLSHLQNEDVTVAPV